MAPSVDVVVKENGSSKKLVINRLTNGDESFPRTRPAGSYQVKISRENNKKPLVSTPFELLGENATKVLAVGSLSEGTFELLPYSVGP